MSEDFYEWGIHAFEQMNGHPINIYLRELDVEEKLDETRI